MPVFKLLKNLIAKYLIVDKAYDFSKITDFIEKQNIICGILSKRTNLIQLIYDKDKYKERNIIEHFSVKLRILKELPLVMKN